MFVFFRRLSLPGQRKNLFSNSYILQASLEELVQGGPSAASSLTTYDEAALCSSAFR